MGGAGRDDPATRSARPPAARTLSPDLLPEPLPEPLPGATLPPRAEDTTLGERPTELEPTLGVDGAVPSGLPQSDAERA